MGIKTYIKRGLRYIRYGEPYSVSNQCIKANIIVSAPSNVLSGKRVVITGGGRGLGFSFAKMYSKTDTVFTSISFHMIHNIILTLLSIAIL